MSSISSCFGEERGIDAGEGRWIFVANLLDRVEALAAARVVRLVNASFSASRNAVDILSRAALCRPRLGLPGPKRVEGDGLGFAMRAPTYHLSGPLTTEYVAVSFGQPADRHHDPYRCGRCQHVNRVDAKFCAECSAAGEDYPNSSLPTPPLVSILQSTLTDRVSAAPRTTLC